MTDPQVAPFRMKATTRFVRDYDRAQPLLKSCAAGALAELRRAFEARPDLALRQYRPVQGIAPAVIEIGISGAARMLAHWNGGCLYLLAVGGHEIVGHYQSTGRVAQEILHCKPMPERLASQIIPNYFTPDVEEDWKHFANEADPSWLQHLDTQQYEAAVGILNRAMATQPGEAGCFEVIAGGPGTGKTSIILNLFDRAWEADLIPRIVIEDHVSDYVRKAIGVDLTPYRCTIGDAKQLVDSGILLVDDPRSVKEIEAAKWLAQSRVFRSVVVGFDPLQLDGDCDDAALSSITNGQKSTFIPLRVCYRQKAVVGSATKRALDSIAASSPYLAVEKKLAFAEARKRVTNLVNDLEFVNPSGRVKKYTHACVSDVHQEVARLSRAPGLWNHSTPYLIAIDDEFVEELPAGWKQALDSLPHADVLPLSRSVEIKGSEYQHALIILSAELFQKLECGFEGSTRKVYYARRLLRIPISRAKDSLTVFVVPNAA